MGTTRKFFYYLCFGFIVMFFVLPQLFSNFSIAFSEEFNSGYSDPSYWESIPNLGNIYFTNEKIILSRSIARSVSFPYIYNKINIFPTDGNFSIDISFRYLNTDNYGDGIVISKSFPANGSSISNNDVFFKVWQDFPLKLRIVSHVCPHSNPNCDRLVPNLFFHTTQSDFNNHLLKINYLDNGIYEVFVDDLDTPAFTSAPNQERPLNILLGNSVHMGNTDYWSSLEIDYVRVTTDGDGGTDTKKTPVVIVPGMGASWDFRAILGGESGDNWIIPDFVNIYDNLINSFENAGYVRGTDLFVFTYDWRKNLNNLADDLSSYLDILTSTGKLDKNQKIDLVGHSMGGLVARNYMQKYGISKIKKLITAGSPHLGATDTYPIWEGATLMDRPWWQKVAFGLLTKINKLAGENEVATVRRLAPGVKDLLPIYDYLILNGQLKSWSSLKQSNAFLDSQRDIAGIDSLTKVLAGSGQDTKYKINAVDRNWLDSMAGKWEDGKPENFVKADGDGTVWLDSALGYFPQQANLVGNHAEMISSLSAITDIFSQLGLDTSKIVVDTIPDLSQSALAVVLRSPGILEVCEALVCNSDLGWYFPDYKLFILPSYADQDIKVKVLENGFGNYSLYIGKVNGESENWKMVEGSLINSGQEDNYLVSIDDGQINLDIPLSPAQNSLLALAQTLELADPGWDENNSIAKVVDKNLDILERLKAARLIRYSLIKAVDKAYSENELGILEKALRVWIGLDRYMKDLLTDDNLINLDQVGRSLQLIPHRRQDVLTEISSSSSFYSGEISKMADQQYNLTEVLPPGQETLRLDKLNSARYLYLLSLELMN